LIAIIFEYLAANILPLRWEKVIMLNFSLAANFTPGKFFSFHPSYFEVIQAEAATG